MDLETYLVKEFSFREYPKDLDACIRSTFGEACFSKFAELRDESIHTIYGKEGFYDFFNSSGLYKFFLQMDKFRVKNSMEYILQQISGKRKVLDVGIGDATKLIWYALNNPETKFIGVDFCKSFMKSAEENFRKYSVRNCSLTYGNLANLPFANESFDLVIADHSLHEFQTEYGGADESFVVTVPEVMRVLKNGGKLTGALTMPHYGVQDIMRYFNYFVADSGGKDLVFEEKIENPEYSSLVLFNAVKSE
jgi:ubiquinone/menaquinone biosynthesis C-methylase UbiE